MGSFTNYTEDALLDHLTGTDTFTPPAGWYVALFTTLPTDSSAGVEVVGTLDGYERVEVEWGPSSAGVVLNTNTVRFPAADYTTVSWGRVVAIGFLDSSTVGAGNFLAYAKLADSYNMAVGTAIDFDPGDLQLTLS